MRVEKKEEIGGVPVVFRELTVGEIRQWIATVAVDAGGSMDGVGDLLFEDFSLLDIALLTDLKGEDIDRLAPSEIEEIFARCKAYNPRFFVLRDRLAKIGDAALSIPQSSS